MRAGPALLDDCTRAGACCSQPEQQAPGITRRLLVSWICCHSTFRYIMRSEM